MRTLERQVARAFEPLLDPARYKGAYGGRGSGKSHFFAEQLVEDSLYERGMLSVCIREVQKSLKDSAKRLIEAKLVEFGLGEADGFKVYADRIQTPGDGVITFVGMQDHTAESVKSLEGFKRAWTEEAQTLSRASLSLLRPTIRASGSELWFSWNPRLDNDPVDVMLRSAEKPTGSVVVRANWDSNPWFPQELEAERLDTLRMQPGQYDHIWEGGYATVLEGAYYADCLAEARRQGRIGRVAPDPLMPLKAFWDIGVKDSTSIWVAQWVGREIRVLDYYEARNQPLATHLDWMRRRGYENADNYLPHDAAQREKASAQSFEEHMREANFKVKPPVPNQGKGADMRRVEAARRIFPAVWFNEATTVAGVRALGWYHETQDEKRNTGLGPEHDWASHAADAFGLMAVVYEAPEQEKRKRTIVHAGGWMG